MDRNARCSIQIIGMSSFGRRMHHAFCDVCGHIKSHACQRLACMRHPDGYDQSLDGRYIRSRPL